MTIRRDAKYPFKSDHTFWWGRTYRGIIMNLSETIQTVRIVGRTLSPMDAEITSVAGGAVFTGVAKATVVYEVDKINTATLEIIQPNFDMQAEVNHFGENRLVTLGMVRDWITKERDSTPEFAVHFRGVMDVLLNKLGTLTKEPVRRGTDPSTDDPIVADV